MAVISLTTFDLALASVLLLMLGGLSWRLRLGVERSLALAAIRTVVQLLLIGWVLKWLFGNAQAWWVALLCVLMLAVAGYEVLARQQQRFVGGWGYALGAISMSLSALLVSVFALLLVIGNEPWWAPQYAIPLVGMILGNTMTGVALTIDNLTATAVAQREQIEAKLMLGWPAREAIAELKRDSLRRGLIPAINAMAAAGIVSLPGMMTGQILAGIPPLDAVKYQILIMFLITAGTGFGAAIAVQLAAGRLFDERERLRLDRLQ